MKKVASAFSEAFVSAAGRGIGGGMILMKKLFVSSSYNCTSRSTSPEAPGPQLLKEGNHTASQVTSYES